MTLPKITPKTFKTFFSVWWCLGVAFFLVSWFVFNGGGALEGKVEQGHYFVAKGSYLHEVSRSFFIFGEVLEVLWNASTAVLAVLYIVVAVQKRDPRWIEMEWKATKKPLF